MSDIRELLSHLVRDPRLEQLKLALKSPNLFSILKIENWEIRHSNFLAWLLDPDGSHNLRDHFLRWFLLEVFSSEKIGWVDEFSIAEYDLHRVRVHREWEHIDLLIEADDFIIAIENKIYSSEHSNQLTRYREKIKAHFPSKSCGFVLLTLDGVLPETDLDRPIYVTINYRDIRAIIENIMSIYKNSFSDRVKFYLEDYLLLINRNIMKDDQSVELARKIYNSHKEAFDFIIENKPDRIGEIGKLVESYIEDKGYVLGHCNKYYARFLPHELVDIIPKTGAGWASLDAFLFELAYWDKGLSLSPVIAPGDEHNRKVLIEIMQNIDGWKTPQGKKWLAHFKIGRKAKLLTERYDDPEEIRKIVNDILDEGEAIINAVTKGVLERRDELNTA